MDVWTKTTLGSGLGLALCLLIGGTISFISSESSWRSCSFLQTWKLLRKKCFSLVAERANSEVNRSYFSHLFVGEIILEALSWEGGHLGKGAQPSSWGQKGGVEGWGTHHLSLNLLPPTSGHLTLTVRLVQPRADPGSRCEDRQQMKCVGAAGFGWAVPGAVTNRILFLNAKQATDNAISC